MSDNDSAALRSALEPFANHASNFDAGECDDHPHGCPDGYPATFSSIYLTVGDFRRARDAFAQPIPAEREAADSKLVEALEAIAAEVFVPLSELPDHDQPNGWRKVATDRIDIARNAIHEYRRALASRPDTGAEAVAYLLRKGTDRELEWSRLTDATIAAKARLALGTWLSWPDAPRDGPRQVSNEQVESWLSGLPSRLANLSQPAGDALIYAISCLCSVRKNYRQENALWDDVDKAITQANAVLASTKSPDADGGEA